MREIAEAIEKKHGVELRPQPDAGPLKRLVDDGRLQRFPVREDVDGKFQGNGGGAYTYRVTDLDQLTLFTIWEAAQENVVPKGELQLSEGRKSTAAGHASRQVLAVHEEQLRTMRAALKKLIHHLVPASRPSEGDRREEEWALVVHGMRQIDASRMVWAEGAGAHGHGDWALLADVDEAARDLSHDSRHKYVGVMRTLLDLGATHGYLIPQEVHGAERKYLPAAWAEALGHWEEIVRASPHFYRSQGTAHLSRIMASLAEFFEGSLDQVDPMALTEKQSRTFGRYFASRLKANERISRHHRSATLAALRALMAAGVMAQVDVTEYDRRRIDGRKSAFAADAIRAIAREFSADNRKLDADYSLFRMLGTGAFFRPEEPYGLPRLVDWFTLRSTRHRRRKNLKAINCYPREALRGTGGLSGRPWVEQSIEYHLELLGIYLGYLTRHVGIDLNGDVDARHLFTLACLDGFIDAVDQDAWTSPDRALEVIKHASLYCSPCWETSAISEGDDSAADQFQAVADYANGRGLRDQNGEHDGLTVYQSQAEEWGLARGDKARIEAMRRRATQVQRVYEAVSGKHYAYLAMLRIRNASIERYCREMAVSSLEELRQLIESGKRVLTRTEFCRLRDLTLYGDSLAAPHRRATISALDLSDYHETSGGVLWMEVPSEKLKVASNGDYELKLGSRNCKPNPASYRFDTRDCYLAARRQWLKEDRTEAMFISAGKENKDGDPYRLAPSSITGLYAEVLRYGAKRLEWDVSPILALDGVSGGHAIRHAVGSYFVAQEKPELARRMLHHRGLDTLLRVYGAARTDTSAEDALAGVEL